MVFHSEVYFVNLVTHMAIKWGTDSKIGLFDPNTGIHFQLGACGEFSIKVNNSRKLLLKLVGTEKNLNSNELFAMNGSVGYFKGLIVTKIKSYIANVIKEQRLNILELDSMLDILSEELHKKIAPILYEYGMEMPQFVVSRILLPEDDPNFRRMKQQFADKYLLVQEEEIRRMEAEAERERKEVEAVTAARVKIIGVQGNAEALRIQKQAEAEAYKMQAEAEAMEMKLKGYTYQQETSRMIGMEAMKNGIGGSEGATSAIGDIAGLGMGLGAMSGVLNMTREAMNPIFEQTANIGSDVERTMINGWSCTCGRTGIISKFCPDCGETQIFSWNCECGNSNLKSKFCPNCGKEKPR